MCVTCRDITWIRVEHASAVGAVRRAAIGLAERLGFGEVRAAEVGIVATELATNQIRHAGGGSMLLRTCRSDSEAGVELVAIDQGPGIAEMSTAIADGHSTAGSLGIGLGAVARLATAWDVFSASGRGTVVTASCGPSGLTAVGGSGAAAGLSRPMTGQEVCGDAYAIRRDGDTISAMLVDGLGHGPLAAHASAVAVRAFRDSPAGGPLTLLTEVHRALPGTRGGAAAVAQVNGSPRVTFAGIGNISGHIFGGAQRISMMSYPGIVGGRTRGFREIGYDLPPRAVVVLHSDGVTDPVDLTGSSSLLNRSPTVVAAVVLRDFGVRNDDASVLVLSPADVR